MARHARREEAAFVEEPGLTDHTWALNLLRTAPNPPRHKKKLSIRQKRTVCGLNGNYRASVLRLANSPPESPAG